MLVDRFDARQLSTKMVSSDGRPKLIICHRFRHGSIGKYAGVLRPHTGDTDLSRGCPFVTTWGTLAARVPSRLTSGPTITGICHLLSQLHRTPFAEVLSEILINSISSRISLSQRPLVHQENSDFFAMNSDGMVGFAKTSKGSIPAFSAFSNKSAVREYALMSNTAQP